MPHQLLKKIIVVKVRGIVIFKENLTYDFLSYEELITHLNNSIVIVHDRTHKHYDSIIVTKKNNY